MYAFENKGQKVNRWCLTTFLLPIMTLCFSGIGQIAFATEDPIVPISGLSPYPPGVDCNVTPQTGTVWRNSETEPYMDVDFGRPNRMAKIHIIQRLGEADLEFGNFVEVVLFGVEVETGHGGSSVGARLSDCC